MTRFTTTTTLDDVASITHGFAFDSSRFSDAGEHVLLTPGNFRLSGGFRTLGSQQKRYSGPVQQRFKLSPGDVLIAMTEQAPGLLGSTLIVPEDGESYLHNQRLGLLRVKDPTRVDLEYLYHWFALPLVRNRIAEQSSGTKVKHTSPTRLASLPLGLPTLPEQRRIAETLRTWDDAIDRSARVRAAKLEIARATLNHMVDSSVDPSVFSLGEIFRERVEVGGVGAPLLSVTQSNGVIRHAESGRKDSSSADRSKYKRVLSGDIAYNTMRMWQGASGLVEEEGIVSPAYTVVVADPSRISPQFAAHVLKSERVKFEFERYSQGITSDTWNLKFPAFSRVTVSIPSLAEQERFNSLLREMHAELTLLDRNLELLRTQKRGLMQKLLTGEVRVQLNAKQKDSADV